MPNPRKIAFLHTIGYPMGGAEKVTAIHSKWFSANGSQCFVFADNFRDNLLTEFYTDRVTLVKIDGHPTGRSFSEDIVRNIAEHGIDFLIIQGTLYRDIDWLSDNLLGSCKLIYCCHGVPFWEIRAHYERRIAKASRSLGQKLKYHLISNPIEHLTAGIRRKAMQYYARIYDRCDAFTVLCEGYRNELLDGPAVPWKADKTAVIGNALAPSASKHNPDKEKTVLSVGRLTYSDKRIDRLLKAWQRVHHDFPDWKLQIVGDGPERTNLEGMARELGLKRYEFMGHSNDVDSLYDHAAIFCLTSTFEGAPLVLAEAQRAGAVPIAFNSVAGISDMLSPNGENGILIEPFDLNTFAEKLGGLMTDEQLRKSMQANVIRKSESYGIEAIGRKWEALFDKLEKGGAAKTL